MVTDINNIPANLLWSSFGAFNTLFFSIHYCILVFSRLMSCVHAKRQPKLEARMNFCSPSIFVQYSFLFANDYSLASCLPYLSISLYSNIHHILDNVPQQLTRVNSTHGGLIFHSFRLVFGRSRRCSPLTSSPI